MTETPGDANDVDVQRVPIEQVQVGYSLLVDEGQGPQAGSTENVRFRSIRGSDGSWVGTYLLMVELLEGGNYGTSNS
jgi:hypothetical protein